MNIPDRIRYINKYFTNRLMMLIAGRKYSPIAILWHTGRKSGSRYAIPIIAARQSDGFVLALTYGFHVDWYKNILAAGTAELTWHGNKYRLSFVSILEKEVGRASFSQPFRAMLRWLGTDGFIHMRTV